MMKMQHSAQAVTFGELTGFLHSPSQITGLKQRGVLMLSPWGFEDLLTRQGWGALAAEIAQTGFPCLRFDWPGMGDSLGADHDIQDVAALRSAVRSAADFLRRYGAVEELVILGQGLGALMAQDMAEPLCASGLVLMAPLPEGRTGMREQAILGSMINSFLRLAPDATADVGLNVAGFKMSQGLVESFKTLCPSRTPLQIVKHALVLARKNRQDDTALANDLRARGAEVAVADYDGYDNFATVHTTPLTPLADFAKICVWLRNLEDPAQSATPFNAPLPDKAVLKGEGFMEEPLRFGPYERLFGVLSTPCAGKARAVAVIVNSGYNAHIGWARAHVQIARTLARQGVAVLRMDCGGLGESSADPAITEDILYHDCQIVDACHGLDAMRARFEAPLLIMGRCSGAYIALNAAERDLHVKGLLAVNALRLIWRPGETLAQAMASGSSSLADYRRRAFSMAFVKTLLRQEAPVQDLGKRLMRKLRAKAAFALAPYSGDLTLSARLTREVRTRFALFAEHGVETRLIYAANDAGLDELANYCGAQGRAIAHQPNLRIEVVAEADHNMTSDSARAAIVASIIDIVETLERQSPVFTLTRKQRSVPPAA